MAVYKSKNGKWYCQFMIKRQRVHKLLDGANDIESAKQLEDAERYKIRLIQNGLLTEETKYTVGFMMNKYKKASSLLATFKDAERQADCITEFFGKNKDIKAIKPSDVEKFVFYLKGKKFKNASINRYLASLKRAYNIMIADDLINYNPCKIKKLDEDNRRFRYLTKEEWQKLKNELSGDVLNIVTVALLSGLRRRNVLELKWEQIDLNLRTIELLKTENKGKKYIKLPIPQSLYELLLELNPRPKGYVFINPKTNKPYTTIKTAFNNALERAGIADFHFHDLRRTVGTWLLTNGVDIRTVQNILAHSDVRTTERYLSLTNEQNIKAMDVLNSYI
jgi:integrase